VRPPVRDPSLRLTPLVKEELLAALPDVHPLARRKTIPVQALGPEPFILFVREHGTGLYDDIIAVCREAGFSPKIVQETNDTQTIVSLVSAGFGVVNFPHPRVVYKRLRGPNASLEIALAEPLHTHSPLAGHFRAIAQSVADGA
jgi:DNA-binding transcriptional LysR family regulator